MGTRTLLPALALGLGLGVLAATTAPAADKAEKPDAARIAKWIEQLGNDDFEEREKASAELDALGEAALDALRQALKSNDEEVHKRAEALVVKIEKHRDSVTALAAKRVHLVYKDAALPDALEDFRKKSGYNLALSDPDNKLKGRTITLDTGDATFWEALDQFCAKAALREADAQDQTPAAGVGFGPAPGVLAASAVPADQITLVDGKPESLPRDASSAVRIRALAGADPLGPAPEGENLIALRLSLEPRLQWQSVDKVMVRKAVDDQKQELIQTSTDAGPAKPAVAPGAIGFAPGVAGGPVLMPFPGAFPPAGLSGGVHQDVAVRLKKGDKVAKALTELSGSVTAQILGETAPVITATDILKAGGKVFKGGANGQLKVYDVSRSDTGQIVIRLELQAPTDVVPALSPNGPAAGPIFVAPPVRRLPAAPAPAAPGGAAPAPGVGVAVARVGIVVGAGGFGSGANGLSLLDDKGAMIKLTGTTMETVMVAAPAGGFVRTVRPILIFQAEKGQEPSKLVYSGRKMLSVEIPFTLKDVPLP